MKPTSTAALVAVLLAMPLLAACDKEEIDRYQAMLTGEDPYGAGSLVIAQMIETDEPPRYVELDEIGPMGEVVATGVDCQPVFRLRICK